MSFLFVIGQLSRVGHRITHTTMVWRVLRLARLPTNAVFDDMLGVASAIRELAFFFSILHAYRSSHRLAGRDHGGVVASLRSVIKSKNYQHGMEKNFIIRA